MGGTKDSPPKLTVGDVLSGTQKLVKNDRLIAVFGQVKKAQ